MIYKWPESFRLGYCIMSTRTLNSDNFIMIKFRVPWNDRQALYDYQELYKAGFSKINLKLYKKKKKKESHKILVLYVTSQTIGSVYPNILKIKFSFLYWYILISV
jgi:hypothetical protein